MNAELELGGAQHELRFTLRALKKIEEKAGKKITDPDFTEWMSSMNGISILLWACLSHENPPMSIDDIDDAIGLEDIPRIAEVLQHGFMDSLPNVPTGRPTLPAATTPRSIGTRSRR